MENATRPIRAHYQCAVCHKILTDQMRRPTACASCGSENSFVECSNSTVKGVRDLATVHMLAVSANVRRVKGVPLYDCDGADVPRMAIFPAIDTVLGGSGAVGEVLAGVAKGCALRIEADKGAGKSTLTLQALGEVAKRGPVVYGTGEESKEAIRGRGARLGIFDAAFPQVRDNLIIVESPVIEDFLDEIKIRRPLFSVFDSAQIARSRSKLYMDTPANAPQMISYVATEIFNLAHKLPDGVICLINQIVKDGTAAGPSIAGFAVDMLLKLARDDDHTDHDETLCPYVAARYLSCGKNRHGPETRRARLAMTGRGLVAWEEMHPAPVQCHQPAPPRRKRAALSSDGG